MRIKFTKENIDFIINEYNKGKQQFEIAKELNCSQTAISGVLKRYNIPTRIGKKIKYNDVNISFFKEINSQESAYYLGLLYADGCVQSKNNAYQITLKLKSDDQIIIEKFRDIMSPSSPIKISYGKYSYFRINQKEICEQLIAHGCIPNKSLTLKFPTSISKNLLSHFLRGYSDGDGCIYKNKLKHGINTIWKIVSTKQFCESVSKFLKDELNINCSQCLTCSNNQITTTLSVGGNIQVKKLLNWLYKDSIIYLPRKFEKYQEFISNF